jgi:hypothetical protein
MASAADAEIHEGLRDSGSVELFPQGVALSRDAGRHELRWLQHTC